MSILDSRGDVDEAKARIESATDERLAADIAYWATVGADHKAEYHRYLAAAEAEKLQYHEALGMQELVVDEIRKRRDRRREEAGS